MSGSITLMDANFEQEVVQSDIPVIVDCWAEWCPPCKMIDPVLDELGARYAGKIKIAKLNTDEQPDLAARFHILGVPTLLLFKDGQVVGQRVGAASRAVLDDIFKELIS